MSEHLTGLPVDELLSLTRRAGDAIMSVYRTPFSVDRKQDDSPLTEADLAAHRLLQAGLEELTPGIPILSEESATAVPAAVRRGWPRLWLVDPLDGTREFVHRRDEFTVNVALIEGHDPVFGIVHLPALDATYWGGAEEGAWRRFGEGQAQRIRCRLPAASPLRVLGSRSHPDPHLEGLLRSLGEVQLQTAGSSLKFCRIAEGAADLYPRFGPTSEWDTAAGQAVVEAAGGAVVGVAGEALRYNGRDSLLNPWFLAYGDPQLDWRSHLPPPAATGGDRCD